MAGQVPHQAEKYKKEYSRRKAWHRIVAALACVVVFCTTYALILPAITMEGDTYCGFTEHQHGPECFEKRLICGYDEAQETSAESTGAESELTETGHVHSDTCYEQQQVLACGQEESAGHVHDESCTRTEQNLICADDHEHTDSCYETVTTYICGKTEGQGAHTHVSECYETQRVLTCQIPEGDAPAVEASEAESTKENTHEHTDDCYEKVLVCDKTEHTHSLSCFSDPEADLETDEDWEKTFADVVLTGNCPEDVLAIAGTQLNYRESEKNYQVVTDDSGAEIKKGYTRYGAWYGKPYEDWCAMFVSFCLNYAQIPAEEFPLESSCADWVQKLSGQMEGYEKYALYAGAADYTPKIGDPVFFDLEKDGTRDGFADHVGLVSELLYENVDDPALLTGIKTIEGDSGDQVAEQSYEIHDPDILGYGILPEMVTDTGQSAANSEEAALAEGTASNETMLAAESAPPNKLMRTAAAPPVYTIENGDFESGWTGWTLDGTTEVTNDNNNVGVVSSDTKYWNGNRYFYQHGNSFLKGADKESLSGSIRSSTFTLGGDGYISFLIGGAKPASGSCVELYQVAESGGDTLVKTYTNTQWKDPDTGNTLLRIYDKIDDEYQGKQLYFVIKNGAGSGFSFINVDDFRTSMTQAEVIALEKEELARIQTIEDDYKGNIITAYRANEPIKLYQISFDMNGDVGTQVTPVYGTAGEKVTLPSEVTPSRTGYTFLGWSKEKKDDVVAGETRPSDIFSPGAEYTIPTDTAADITLYAVWQKDYTAGMTGKELTTFSPGSVKIDLFDYRVGMYNWEDATQNMTPWDDTGINQGHYLKFAGDGMQGDIGDGGLVNRSGATSDSRKAGIVNNNLGVDGYPVLSGSSGVFTPAGVYTELNNKESLAYLFDTNNRYLVNNETQTTGTPDQQTKKAYSDVQGLLLKNGDTYYYNSGVATGNMQHCYAKYKVATNSFKVTDESSNGGNAEGDGFFPFGTKDETEKAKYRFFGMHINTKFTLNETGKKTDGNNTVFHFSGDDDVWIFIDGKLVGDVGGMHTKQSVDINFADGTVTYRDGSTSFSEIFNNVDLNNGILKAGSHTLDFFYLERAAGRSNLELSFNLDVPDNKARVDVDVEKVDQANDGTKLAGAKFRLYRKESTDNKEYYKSDVTNGTTWVADDNSATTLATDENGNLSEAFSNLVDTNSDTGENGYTTYYLEEIEAPAGYKPLTKPIEIWVAIDNKTDGTRPDVWVKFLIDGKEIGSSDGYFVKKETSEPVPKLTAEEQKYTETTYTYTLTVPNTSDYKLPETGGPGTILHVTGGVMLAIGAGILLLYRHKKRRKEDSAPLRRQSTC